ncbi:hypothetical protein EDD11_008079 [Mortierella claussenii]|nr:hypothetical protein EDD11_008079 [Mortierella claussenii]
MSDRRTAIGSSSSGSRGFRARPSSSASVLMHRQRQRLNAPILAQAQAQVQAQMTTPVSVPVLQPTHMPTPSLPTPSIVDRTDICSKPTTDTNEAVESVEATAKVILEAQVVQDSSNAQGTTADDLDPEDDPSTTNDVDTATHIVVEHHRSGTVRTHVFASKDGQPSLMGHVIPDTSGETISGTLGDKLHEISTLVQDSLEFTKRESLDRLEGLKVSIEENGHRVASQASLAAALALESQIRNELVPKLDRIELMLSSQGEQEGAVDSPLSNQSGSIESVSCRSASGRNGILEEQEDSRTSMEPMDPVAADVELSEGRSLSGEAENIDEQRSSSLHVEHYSVVMEKLSSIEGQVHALCKVVIDGAVPAVGEGMDSDPDINSDALARFSSMRDELTTFPDTLREAQLAMQELIEALARNRDTGASSASPMRASAKAAAVEREAGQNEQHQAREQWQSTVLEMMHLHRDGLGSLNSQFQIMDSNFKRMDTGFQEWRRSHQLSLQVYLKYMFWIFKRTEKIDTKVQQTLEEIKDHFKVDSDHRTQFSSDLNQMRTDILAVLTSLPDLVINQLQQPTQPMEDKVSAKAEEKINAAYQAQQDELVDDGVGVDEAASYQLDPQSSADYIASNTIGTRALGVPGPRVAAGLSETGANDNAGNDTDAEPDTIADLAVGVVAPQGTPTLASDPIERLVQTVETLQASIACMIENYNNPASSAAAFSKTSESSHPNENPPGNAVSSALTNVLMPFTSGPVQDLEVPEPPSRETSLERCTQFRKEQLAQKHTTSSPGCLAVEAVGELGATEATERAARDSHATRSMDPQAPPANGYKQSPGLASQRDMEASRSSANAAAACGDCSMESEFVMDMGSDSSDPVPPPGMSQELFHELESMKRDLGELLLVITNTTSNLAQGHVHLQEEFRREIERVLEAVHSPLTDEDHAKKQAANKTADKYDEERRIALDRISIIPNLMTLLENLNHNHTSKAEEAMREIQYIKAFTAGLDSRVGICHRDVQNILRGSMEDSSVLSMIKGYVETIVSEQGCAGDIVLREQVAEAIRTAADVYALVEDVRNISTRSLSRQEVLERKLEELQTSHDQGVESWIKKHDEGWQTWYDRHSVSLSNIEGWHDKHDKDLRDLDDWRHMHHKELQDWHKEHDIVLKSWRKPQSDQPNGPEKHCCCHCSFASSVGINKDPYAAAATEGSSVAIETKGEDAEPVHADAEVEASASKAIPKSFSKATGTCNTTRNGNEQGSPRVVSQAEASSDRCCSQGRFGDDIPATTTRDSLAPSPASQRARLLFEEFLREAIPGYDGCCLACGRLSRPTEDGAPVRIRDGIEAERNVEGDGEIEGMTLDPAGSIQQEQTDKVTSKGDGSGQASNLGATAKAQDHSTKLLRELYDFLKPYFDPVVAQLDPMPAEGSRHCSTAGDDANIATRCLEDENEGVEGVRRELRDLQEQYMRLAQESRENEDTVARQMRDILKKDHEMAQMVSDHDKSMLEIKKCNAELSQKVVLLKEKLEAKKQKLTNANANIEKLYREGLGLSTGMTAEDTAQETGISVPPLQHGDTMSVKSNNTTHTGHSGDDDTVDSIAIPRYSLMSEAAEHLRQVLEETKLQKAGLYHDIGMLEAKRNQIADDIANMEGQYTAKYARDTHDPEGSGSSSGGSSIVSRNDIVSDGYVDVEDRGDDEGHTRSRTRARGCSTMRQQKRVSAMGRRGASQSRTRSSRGGSVAIGKVPQLEADIKICKDGVASETLLSSKTLLTEETFDRIRPGADGDDEDGEMWSLFCDFRVRMVPS